METIVRAIGSPWTIPGLIVGLVAVYTVVGLDATNLAISIVTLLLLPILQGSQNRDSAAVEAKLDALIKGVPDAPNTFVGIDKKSEREIEELRNE